MARRPAASGDKASRTPAKRKRGAIQVDSDRDLTKIDRGLGQPPSAKKTKATKGKGTRKAEDDEVSRAKEFLLSEFPHGIYHVGTGTCFGLTG